MSLPNPNYTQSEWNREAKRQLDPLISGYPFPTLAADPITANLRAGYTYFNSVSTKVRTWDGALWQIHY